jgi:ribosomal protein S18 acetylase RimI-like enzyme
VRRSPRHRLVLITQFDEEVLWRVYVDAIDRRADSEWIERPGWVQIRTRSSSTTGHNKILRADLDPREADRVIEDTCREHAARGAGFSWIVAHGSGPLDLSERLDAGGVPHRGAMLGMVRSVAGVRRRRAADLTIRRGVPGDAATIADLGVRAWNRSEAFRAALRANAERALADPDSNTSFWLAYASGELVGSATLRALPSGLGYLQGAWVLPAHRGRGIYTALTQARMTALEQAGIEHVTIWANADSGAVAERMGFVTVARGAYHDVEREPADRAR